MMDYSNMKYSDSAFLYVIFTFQVLTLLIGVPLLLRDGCSEEKRREKKKSLVIRAIIFTFVAKWLVDTHDLVQAEIEAGDMSGFDPYKLLHIDNDSSFGTKQIRDAYYKLAKKYHPDKVNLDKIPIEKARRRYQNLVKAYHTLTKRENFDNWVKFGDPDGLRSLKALEIALPAFL